VTATGWLARRDVTFGAVALLFAVQAALRFSSHLTHDAAWYLYAAGRLLDGAALNRDIVEVNPPLGIWLTVPVAGLARLSGAPATALFKGTMLALTALSLVLSRRLIRAVPGLAPPAANALLILTALLMLFLPAFDFGQREHGLILLVTPWLYLRGGRLTGATMPAALAMLAGFLAALGFGLKPHSVLAVAAVEILVLAWKRNLRLTFAAENVAALMAGLAYIAAVLWFAGAFLGEMVPRGAAAYVPFYGYGFAVVLGRMIPPAALGLVAIFGVGAATPPFRDLGRLLIAAGAGFLAAFALQAGYRYQLIPALYVLTLAAGLRLTEAAAGAPAPGRHGLLSAALSAAGVIVVITGVATAQMAPYRGTVFEAAIAREAPAARSVFIASTNVFHPFPLVEEKGLLWASRFPAQWLAPYAAATLGPDGGPSDAIGRFALSAAVDDLVAFKPDIVFIDEGAEQSYFRDKPIDWLGFYGKDPCFGGLWAGYERRPDAGRFAVYVRRAD
jgi:hypothetical protein